MELFGTKKMAATIEFFMKTGPIDFGATDVAKETGLSNQSAYFAVEDLTKLGVLKRTRVMKSKQYYALDAKNKISKAMKKMFMEVLKN